MRDVNWVQYNPNSCNKFLSNHVLEIDKSDTKYPFGTGQELPHFHFFEVFE